MAVVLVSDRRFFWGREHRLMKRPRKPRTPPSFGVEEMVRRYVSGISMEDIGLASGTSASFVKDRLLKAGVAIRKRGGPKGPAVKYHRGGTRGKKE
jgi:hypothetical protein